MRAHVAQPDGTSNWRDRDAESSMATEELSLIIGFDNSDVDRQYHKKIAYPSKTEPYAERQEALDVAIGDNFATAISFDPDTHSTRPLMQINVRTSVAKMLDGGGSCLEMGGTYLSCVALRVWAGFRLKKFVGGGQRFELAARVRAQRGVPAYLVPSISLSPSPPTLSSTPSAGYDQTTAVNAWRWALHTSRGRRICVVVGACGGAEGQMEVRETRERGDDKGNG
ncbi:hypothetical protein NLJ89_g3655 [Agrocybe chaxingu]|uniref:Uncharacterized protein n=1 Tax=Agrocybe chaxingu TaxID=84603 RepID=A0A9W8K4V0_9AGAR|nr:hypothetical protein NLJ89_g3655 [Agrocybe chaxingu]